MGECNVIVKQTIDQNLVKSIVKVEEFIKERVLECTLYTTGCQRVGAYFFVSKSPNIIAEITEHKSSPTMKLFH